MNKTSPHLLFTVTNDLTYDRRMDRICQALASNGFQVSLVGRKLKNSSPLGSASYARIRLTCWFAKGFLFYAEYNFRLFLWLITQSFQVVCACDLDTALACKTAAWLKHKKSVLDAHEYYTESPEIIHRPVVKAFWEWVGRSTVSRFNLRYTVGGELARIMSEKYNVPFHVIRNIAPAPTRATHPIDILDRPKIMLYQGALNIGRGLEVLIPALSKLPGWQLWLAGEGDITQQLQEIVKKENLADRVKFLGWVLPADLPTLMTQARIGINLREKGSLNDYYSLPNKFFDFIQAGLPSVNMKYPEYEQVCAAFPCAVLLEHLTTEHLTEVIKNVDEHPEHLSSMVDACREAAKYYTWENESQKLIELYSGLIAN